MRGVVPTEDVHRACIASSDFQWSLRDQMGAPTEYSLPICERSSEFHEPGPASTKVSWLDAHGSFRQSVRVCSE